MRILILVLCALLVAGVVATTVVALWSTRESAARRAAFRQSPAAEFVDPMSHAARSRNPRRARDRWLIINS
jgi:hypothetical protein